MSRIEIRAKKIFDDTKLNLSIYNVSKLKKVSMMEAGAHERPRFVNYQDIINPRFSRIL